MDGMRNTKDESGLVEDAVAAELKPCILIVEDEALVAMDLEQSLEAMGINVVGIADSEAGALAIAQENRVDLVLMDINLRGREDGVNVTRALLEVTDVPVVFLTAYGDDTTLARALDTSPYGYLLKPVDERTLAATVRAAVRRHIAERRARWIQRVFDLAPVAFAVLGTGAQHGRVVHMNQAMQDILGVRLSPAGGEPFSLPVADPEDEAWGRIQAAVEGETEATEIVRCVHANGRKLWASVAVAPVRDASGMPRQIIVVLADITAEMVSERALSRAKRIRAVEAFLRSVLPQINDFISQAMVVSDVVLRELDSASPSEERSATVQDLRTLLLSGREMNQLAERLMALASSEGMEQASRVDIVEVIRESRSMLRRVLGPGMQLDLRLVAEAAPVQISRVSLEQLLLELTRNAVDASSAGARIRVSADVPRVRGQRHGAGRYVRISVSDEGKGMDEDTLGQVFDPARHVPGEDLFSGLGLYLCRRLVERAGGALSVASEPGVGTQVQIELPLAHVVRADARSGSFAARGPEAGLRCLVVEGAPLLRSTVGRILESRAIDVHLVPSGKSALARLVDPAETWDVVIVGEELGSVEADRIMMSVSDAHPGAVLIRLVGTSNELLREQVPSSHIVFKPVDADGLLRVIRRALVASTGPAIPRSEPERSPVMSSSTSPFAPIPDTERGRLFREALGTLFVHYQPLIRASSGTVCGYEALMRTSHPVLKGPLCMIDAALELGAMPRLGHRVRTCIAQDLAAHPDNFEPIYVNLHPSELTPDLLEPDEPLRQHAPRIVFEVTERARLGAVSGLEDLLEALREVGYRFAVDDLGEGYAGLVSIQRMKPEIVKLDMTLVRNVHHSRYQQDLIRALQVFFRANGHDVVAEGIETREEALVMIDLGVTILQGYLFAKPGPPFVEPVPLER